jgi:hypothetical protein
MLPVMSFTLCSTTPTGRRRRDVERTTALPSEGTGSGRRKPAATEDVDRLAYGPTMATYFRSHDGNVVENRHTRHRKVTFEDRDSTARQAI